MNITMLKRLGITLMLIAVLLCPVRASAVMAKLVDGGAVSYHQTLTAAEDAVISGHNAAILAQAGTFRDSPRFNSGGRVTLSGGYNAAYSGTVGKTAIEGTMTILSGTVVTDNILLTSRLANPVQIIYLHHSTGGNIWDGGVPGFFDTYNATYGTDYRITERAYPNDPYPWDNYPYDYWKLWVDTTGSTGYLGQDTLDTLADYYDIIMFKHCFPVSDVDANTGSPDITSDQKTIENYQLQYNALKVRLHQFPNRKFVVWTGAARLQTETNPENAERARQFFNWVRNSWDEPGDNIFVWDFRTLETNGGLYLEPAYSVAVNDSHPNETFSAAVAPAIGRRIVDVIEGAGDSGSITGR